MKKIVLFTLFAAASSFALACSNNNGNNDGGTDSGPIDSATQDVAQNDSGQDAGNPPPTLKTQIDRMGRPAINTALDHVFDTTSGQGTAKNAYNADNAVASWGTNWIPTIEPNLGVYDGLDRVCGNQVGYAKTNSYAALAGLTADDQLYVNTSTTTCTTYLGVELNALGLTTAVDCGGRMMTYDVIGITYGALAGVTGAFPDGTTAVSAKTSGTTFPYLVAAQ
jgi:hypothetical protein